MSFANGLQIHLKKQFERSEAYALPISLERPNVNSFLLKYLGKI